MSGSRNDKTALAESVSGRGDMPHVLPGIREHRRTRAHPATRRGTRPTPTRFRSTIARRRIFEPRPSGNDGWRAQASRLPAPAFSSNNGSAWRRPLWRTFRRAGMPPSHPSRATGRLARITILWAARTNGTRHHKRCIRARPAGELGLHWRGARSCSAESEGGENSHHREWPDAQRPITRLAAH